MDTEDRTPPARSSDLPWRVSVHGSTLAAFGTFHDAAEHAGRIFKSPEGVNAVEIHISDQPI